VEGHALNERSKNRHAEGYALCLTVKNGRRAYNEENYNIINYVEGTLRGEEETKVGTRRGTLYA
jgi:hypothetical protein